MELGKRNPELSRTPWSVGYLPERMFACEGSVVTFCACAAVKRTPPAASRSIHGVSARLLPYAPIASARSVSIVIRRTSRCGRVGSDGRDGHHVHTAAPMATLATTAVMMSVRCRPRGGCDSSCLDRRGPRIGSTTFLTFRLRKPLKNRLRSEEHTSELQSRQYLVC